MSGLYEYLLYAMCTVTGALLATSWFMHRMTIGWMHLRQVMEVHEEGDFDGVAVCDVCDAFGVERFKPTRQALREYGMLWLQPGQWPRLDKQ